VIGLITAPLQSSFEGVDENIGSKVTDMSVVVDSGSTGINAYLSFFEGLEKFHGASAGIVELNRSNHHHIHKKGKAVSDRLFEADQKPLISLFRP
tara:strand:+ start:399 stop:683 length:285 start_codon:yes stop_codon:yes gene_type:complete